MQYKQAKIYLFVAYLGLLLNLGPSLHYLECLGFHTHGGESSNCCHVHHSNDDTCGQSHTNDSVAHYHCCHDPVARQSHEELSVGGNGDGHDCVFCQFFDQYHVTVAAWDALVIIGASSHHAIERPWDIRSAIFTPVARGPPATV